MEIRDFHLIASLGLAMQAVDRELKELGWSAGNGEVLESTRLRLVGRLRNICTELVSSKSFEVLLAVATVLECVEKLAAVNYL